LLQALPGAAAQLTALTVKPLGVSQAPLIRWRHLSHLCQLCSLSLTADLSCSSGAMALGALTRLTRLRLQGTPKGTASWRPQGVERALLAAPTSLLRLELARVKLYTRIHLFQNALDQDQIGEQQAAVLPPAVNSGGDADDELVGWQAEAGGSTPGLGGSASDDDGAAAAALMNLAQRAGARRRRQEKEKRKSISAKSLSWR
jgi:hypothetical protein